MSDTSLYAARAAAELQRGPVTRAALIAEARTWRGVPFRHQGRSREGVDCVGLVMCVTRVLCLTNFEFVAYRMRADGQTMMRLACEQLREIDRAHMAPGDVALFRVDSDPQHMALVVDYSAEAQIAIIHASWRPEGRVVENRIDAEWRARLVAAFAVPGVQ